MIPSGDRPTILFVNLPSSLDEIVKSYVSDIIPDADYSHLDEKSSIGIIRSGLGKPYLKLIIMEGSALDRLSMRLQQLKGTNVSRYAHKLHRYTNDDDLRKFLELHFKASESVIQQTIADSVPDSGFESDLVITSTDASSVVSSQEIDEYKEQIRVLEAKVSELQGEIDKLSSSTQDTQLDELRQELVTVTDELKKTQDECFVLKVVADKANALQDELNTLQGNYDALEVAKEELSKVNTDLENDIRGLNERNSLLEANGQQLLTDISGYKVRIGELEKQLSDGSADVANHIAKLEGTISNAVTEKDNLLLKLKESDLRIQELVSSNSQLQETLDDCKQDIQDKTDRVAKLEGSLSECQVLNENLKSELSLKSNELVGLRADLEGKDNEIERVSEEIRVLRSDIQEHIAKIAELGSINSSTTDELERVKAELSGCRLSLKEKTSEVEKLTADVDAKVRALADLQGDFDVINSDLTNKGSLVEKLMSEKEAQATDLVKATEELKKRDSRIVELTATLEDLRGTSDVNATLNKSLSELQAKYDDLNDKYGEVDDNLIDARCEIDNLLKKLGDAEQRKIELMSGKGTLEHKVKELEDKLVASSNDSDALNKLKLKLEQLESDADNLRAELSKKSDELNRATAVIEKSKSDREKQDSLLVDFNELQAKYTHLSSDNATITKKLEALNSSYSTVQSDFTNLRSELIKNGIDINNLSMYSDLQMRVTKLSALSESLTKENERLKVFERDYGTLRTDVQVLTSQLSEANARVLELESESLLTTSVNSDADEKLSALQEKFDVLEGNYDMLRASSTKTIDTYKSQLTLARDDIVKMKSELNDCQSKLSIRTSELNAMRSSVFSSMAGSISPNSARNISLNIPTKPYKNIYVFANCGSESTVSLYKLLNKQVNAKPDVSYVILDLTTDSHIDRELGATPKNTPIPWLQGEKSVEEFLAPTRHSNAKVLTTALSYVNDLFLLEVDWGSRFEELSMLADVVIINVGCLGNIVKDILFSSFTLIMRGLVVVKATPINMRIALLNLAGFKSLTNTRVLCTDYAEASKPMLDKLSAKYSTKVLRDNEVMNLQ